MNITIREVVKRFGAVTAVDRADLTVRDGELFTLLGPSGCGKTTLLRLLAGFYQPDSGEIRFGDRVVSGLPPYERNIGMVFQNYALWPHMTVAANVAYGLKLKKLGSAEVAARLARETRVSSADPADDEGDDHSGEHHRVGCDQRSAGDQAGYRGGLCRAEELTDGGECKACGTPIAGRFQRFGKPFGPRRIPVRLAQPA